MSELLEFSWPVYRAGYELDRREYTGSPSSFDHHPGLWIVPKVGSHSAQPEVMMKFVDYREPLKLGLSVFMKFINCDASPEAALRFTEAFGFLSSSSHNDPQGMYVDEWLNHHENMLSAVGNWENDNDISQMVSDYNAVNLGPLKTRLRGNRIGTGVSVVLEPANLWAMMWIEFALHVSNKSGLKQCEWCGEWFPYGTGTGRRSKARFCGDPCRKANHLQSKKEDVK